MKILWDVIVKIEFLQVLDQLWTEQKGPNIKIHFCDFPEKVPGKNHGDLHDSLVGVRVEIRLDLPLFDDVLPELLLPLVYQLHRIELGETVVRTRDVVVKLAVLRYWF